MNSPQASDGVNQPLIPLEKKKSKLDNDLYEIRVLVRICQICDNEHGENERGYVITLHDILIEKLTKYEDLVGQL